MKLYEILGVDKTATQKEIKKSYRSLSQQHHPDKNGGQASGYYLEVKAAYEILSDVQKRKDYDAGEKAAATSLHDVAINSMESLFSSALDNPKILETNIIEIMGSMLKHQVKDLERAKNQAERFIKRLRNVKRKIKCKNKNDIFTRTVDERIRRQRDLTTENEQEIAVLNIMADMLESYEFDYDQSEEPLFQSTATGYIYP